MSKKKKQKHYRDILPKKLKPVRVRWADVCIMTGWFTDNEEIAETLEMESLGWLIHKDKNTLLMAMSIDKHQVGEVLAIPRGCVVEIIMLDD